MYQSVAVQEMLQHTNDEHDSRGNFMTDFAKLHPIISIQFAVPVKFNLIA